MAKPDDKPDKPDKDKPEHPDHPEHPHGEPPGQQEEKPDKPGKPPEEPEARSIGPMDGDPELTAETLKGGATLVASSGEQELTQFPPIAVTASDFRPHLGKMLYTERVALKLGDSAVPVTVNGFGLIGGDDVQIDYCELGAPVVVNPNTTVSIDNSITF